MIQQSTSCCSIGKEYAIDCKKKNLTEITALKVLSNLSMFYATSRQLLSNQVIQHLRQCIKYIFSKNKGDVDGMRENLRALPQPFRDYSYCYARCCGYKREGNSEK